MRSKNVDPITEIANTTSRPEKFIGIHFFNPPQLMKLVEVIPGQKTSQEVTDLTQEYVKSINKNCDECLMAFVVYFSSKSICPFAIFNKSENL